MLTDPLQTAQDAAHAAIARLADAGHRAAHEHAHALDLLRAQVESLRAINAGLRERIEVLEHRVTHTAEVLAMPVDTEAPPVREVVRGMFDSVWPMIGSKDSRMAINWKDGTFSLYANENSDGMGLAVSEAAAIRWVLDGVLP
jgi:hypothetical protein